MRPRSDGWTSERLEALAKARADQALYEEATHDFVQGERRAARLDEVRWATTALNKRILHSRRSYRLRRAAAKVAKASRKRNRV